MNPADDVRPRQRKQIVVPLQVTGMIGKPLPAKIVLLQLMPLHHRAHRAIQKQDALRQLLPQLPKCGRFIHRVKCYATLPTRQF